MRCGFSSGELIIGSILLVSILLSFSLLSVSAVEAFALPLNLSRLFSIYDSECSKDFTTYRVIMILRDSLSVGLYII